MSEKSSESLYWIKGVKESQTEGRTTIPRNREDGYVELAVAIGGPSEITRARALIALVDGHDTPYAFLGLAQKIQDFEYGKNDKTREEFNKFLAEHKDKIKTYIGSFPAVPQEFIKSHGHARIQGPRNRRRDDILEILEREKYQATGENYYTWQEVFSMLMVIAHFLDEHRRKTGLPDGR